MNLKFKELHLHTASWSWTRTCFNQSITSPGELHACCLYNPYICPCSRYSLYAGCSPACASRACLPAGELYRSIASCAQRSTPPDLMLLPPPSWNCYHFLTRHSTSAFCVTIANVYLHLSMYLFISKWPSYSCRVQLQACPCQPNPSVETYIFLFLIGNQLISIIPKS